MIKVKTSKQEYPSLRTFCDEYNLDYLSLLLEHSKTKKPFEVLIKEKLEKTPDNNLEFKLIGTNKHKHKSEKITLVEQTSVNWYPFILVLLLNMLFTMVYHFIWSL